MPNIFIFVKNVYQSMLFFSIPTFLFFLILIIFLKNVLEKMSLSSFKAACNSYI